jgi:hypothetical protein
MIVLEMISNKLSKENVKDELTSTDDNKDTFNRGDAAIMTGATWQVQLRQQVKMTKTVKVKKERMVANSHP